MFYDFCIFQLSIENVQRSFHKYIFFKADLMYSEMETDYKSLLHIHGMISLELDRERQVPVSYGSYDSLSLLSSLNVFLRFFSFLHFVLSSFL